MRKLKIRDILLSKEFIESRIVYKYALLRGQLGSLLGAICTAYIFIDIYNEVFVFIPWYVAGIAASALIVFLNRIRLYKIASISLIIFANLLVFLFAISDNPAGGVYFFFMATAATGLVLLNQDNYKLAIGFALVSLLLAFLAYFGDFGSPIPAPLQSASHLKTSFAVNFSLGILSCILIIHFVTRRNKESEESLLENQEQLRKITKELEQSRNRFSMAVEGSKAGIYEWHVPSNEVYVSSRWLELLGYSEDDNLEVSLEFFLSLIHPEDVEASNQSIQNAIAGGSTYDNELRLKLKNGDFRWFHDTGIVKKDNGTPLVAVGSINDIHDKKIADQKLIQNNKELEKTNAELDRFVYSASHDMRAPLSTLMGLLDLVMTTDDPKEINEYYELMKNRIYTMEGFIKEITDYSRNARLEVQASKTELLPLVREVADSFEFLANEAEVKIEISIDPGFEIITDIPRLKVILNNLVANSIKYHDPYRSDRFVRISAVSANDFCLIEVIDNGLGIKEEYQEKIFEMFFRASEKSGGSGLGLYIVKETLERLNGSISYNSNPEGGSTFRIEMPEILQDINKVKEIREVEKVNVENR